ncbi:hypothetical protein DBR11_06290 [Pedobacter sp. HMWF019]|uniref:hypothetical protein n=1 Tax=Pedobacter sp. HMWF019 TaxID=2056856 RepID=UPI000D360415|nr:hypothetical protein [Pedobacter sp. HMWF019]PTT01900.1 hypothetical protein DBR11_06290 [Pedobacter sp. HMWF019]
MKSYPAIYNPHLEWEAIDFPLVLNSLKIEDPEFQLDENANLEVWRDDNLQLKAKIVGKLKDFKYSDKYIGQGNITQHQIIEGVDKNGNRAKLNRCIFGGYQINSLTHNESGHLTTIDLLFDTVEIQFLNDGEKIPNKHFEWFLCSGISSHFYGATSRSFQDNAQKVRIGIDEYDSDKNLFVSSSTSRDFIVLDIPQIKCIIAKVPDHFMKGGMTGICFEFRDEQIAKLNEELLRNLRRFVSFLFGQQFYYYGYSKLRDDYLVETLLDSPDISLKPQPPMPPIHFNFEYEWGNIQLQLNSLFARYLELQKKLLLDHAVERLHIALVTPVGVNLPILAGALEIIAGKYLDMTGNIKLEYLPQKEYDTLIANEVSSLTAKLSTFDGGEIIINKLKGAFRKGPNEKINFFLSILGLDIEKQEKAAINLRNKMTHGNRNYSNDKTVNEDVVLSRVYHVLFNRIVLKILGYDGYYIDYSIQRSPSKPIKMGAGELLT